jgi:hypothetical protein
VWSFFSFSPWIDNVCDANIHLYVCDNNKLDTKTSLKNTEIPCKLQFSPWPTGLEDHSGERMKMASEHMIDSQLVAIGDQELIVGAVLEEVLDDMFAALRCPPQSPDILEDLRSISPALCSDELPGSEDSLLVALREDAPSFRPVNPLIVGSGTDCVR